MPDLARVIKFPGKPSLAVGREVAASLARAYFESREEADAAARRTGLLERPDLLMAVFGVLRADLESKPASVFAEASAIYMAIRGCQVAVGHFDERDYFLGDAAFLAGTAARLLGNRESAETWLNRAEAGYRNTVNPAPALARVAYQRLGLCCESARYEEVIELAPMLRSTFDNLGMLVDAGKCRYLEAIALKQSGNYEEALVGLFSLTTSGLEVADSALVAMAFSAMADIHSAKGQFELAFSCYRQALPLLRKSNRPAAFAHMKATVGDALRRQGNNLAAVEAYRESVAAYEAIGMSTFVAYQRIVTAQALLEAGRPREAEWEVLQALPTIDEQRMVPEGYTAVALLRESVRLRKTDAQALSELREYLGARS